MAHKRKGSSQLQKLAPFFLRAPRGLSQDGAGGTSPSASSRSGSATPSPRSQGRSHRQSAEASTPLSLSPVKSKPRRAPDLDREKVSTCQEPLDDTRELAETINSFPTNNQPISDTELKDMLVSLRSSLHADMMECMRGFKTDINEMGERVDHVEHKMGKFASTFNSLVDAHNDQTNEVAWLKANVADLEDRSRRNNIKLRGIPESIPPGQMQQYAQDLMGAFLPDLFVSDLVIDRIHRLPKPSPL